MPEARICPLTRLACLGKVCAWWVEVTGTCAAVETVQCLIALARAAR